MAHAGAAMPSPARTRASASSGASSGDQRSGLAGTGGSSPVSALQFARIVRERRAEVEGRRVAALLTLARPLGVGCRLVDRPVGREHHAVARRRELR